MVLPLTVADLPAEIVARIGTYASRTVRELLLPSVLR